ncbi:MAG: hypothetical protein EOO60_11930 [Hymenobacter sp.]|nr:MAG: hypothetical protein EOO60_11930 [Hymenobacter sp.]
MQNFPLGYSTRNLVCWLAGCLLVGNSPLRAQVVESELTPRPARVLNLAGLTYLGLAATQERRLTEQLTVSYGLGLHYSFFDNNANPPIFGTRFINVLDKAFGYPYSTRGLIPFVAVEVRAYQLAKRAFKGRSVRGNSANYVALATEIPFASGSLLSSPNLALAYPVGLKYGLRRALSQHLYAEGSLGAFLKLSPAQTALQPRLDAAIGWYWQGSK